MDIRRYMKVESIEDSGSMIIVTTTGAEYVFQKDGDKGVVTCRQRLNASRHLATIELEHPLPTLTVEHRTDSTCVLHQAVEGCGGYLRFQVNSDSVLDIYCGMPMRVKIKGDLAAKHSSEKNGSVVMLDEIGGIGVYPYKKLLDSEFSNATQNQWDVKYNLGVASRLLVSVFPPRERCFSTACEDGIAHHGSIGSYFELTFPTDEMIDELAQHANVLVLHADIWKGKLTRKGKKLTNIQSAIEDAMFVSYYDTPVNENELRRVIQKSHSVGMKVIPYMSPHYSVAKGSDYLDRLRDVQEKYEFDGVYLDEISQIDIMYAYQMMRDIRELLGNKIIYYHSSFGPLASKYLLCPFIDTYADYTLKAELGESIGDFGTPYLQYIISGINTSNAIGYFCYYEYSNDFIESLIERAIELDVRFYLGSPETDQERLLKEKYFPKLKQKLKQLRNQH
jgi:hypothetical protein